MAQDPTAATPIMGHEPGGQFGLQSAAPRRQCLANPEPDLIGKQGITGMLRIKTSLGSIEVNLFTDKAPVSVKNFLAYVEQGFFDDTIFHRVIPNFMIQCGGFTADMQQKKTNAPIANEANNGVSNKRGTLAMARTSDINSATSQFFINLSDNTFLDHSDRDFGYAVFGEVTAGMDVVDKIAAAKTGRQGMHDDVPLEPIKITAVEVTD